MIRAASTYTLIAERYLDTQHEPSYVQELEAELAARGVVGFRRLGYEYIAASALWWNILMWEWAQLDEGAIRAGWIMNAALFGVVAAPVLYFAGALASAVAVALLHGATLLVALLLRSGTLPKQPPKDGNAT